MGHPPKPTTNNSQQKALTLVEVVFTLAVLAILVSVFITAIVEVVHKRREVFRDRMRRSGVSNLHGLGVAMIQYIDQMGKGRYYS